MLPSMISSCVPGEKKNSIGLQLYSLRDQLRRENGPDFEKSEIVKVLEAVAKAGYDKLECFGYKNETIFGIPYKEFNTVVKDLGMRITSGHYSTGYNSTDKGNLRNDWERAVADAKEVGQEYVVVPYLDGDERKTIDDYKKVCELLNKGAEVCQRYGVRLGYHNHEFEFQKIEDQIPYDVMLSELDPKLVAMELDIYWIVYAGYNPIDYFSKYPSRFELWHVKDMEKKDRDINADVGTGSIDFAALIKHANHAGLKHYFIEQEDYPVSALESIKVSFDNFNKML